VFDTLTGLQHEQERSSDKVSLRLMANQAHEAGRLMPKTAQERAKTQSSRIVKPAVNESSTFELLVASLESVLLTQHRG